MKLEMSRAGGISANCAADCCFLASLPGGLRALRQALHRWETHGGKTPGTARALTLLRPRPVLRTLAKPA